MGFGTPDMRFARLDMCCINLIIYMIFRNLYIRFTIPYILVLFEIYTNHIYRLQNLDIRFLI